MPFDEVTAAKSNFRATAAQLLAAALAILATPPLAASSTSQRTGIPAAFHGRWAVDAAECTNPYATRRLTVDGFDMPELSESTIRVDPLGKRGDSMLMEYSATVADIVYRGRRLIHLSRDSQRLSIEELGEVEIGSIDPEWKPDPLARLHEPGEAPVRREVLVRC